MTTEDRSKRFGVEARDLVWSPPTMQSILTYLGVRDRPEREQRRAVADAVEEQRLGKLELDVLREVGWL